MATELFKPMKAPSVSVNLAALTYPRLVSYKLDGIRGTVQNGQLYSNSMKLIPNQYAQKLFGDAKLNGLDGELIVGPPNAPDAYRRTMSALMSRDGEPEELRFHVFDHLAVHGCIQFEEPYKKRLERLKYNFSGEWFKDFCPILPQVLVESEAQLLRMEAEALALGYEGLMIRSVNGIYKPGPNRSTQREGLIFKLKRFEDSEMNVMGVEEAMENHNEAKTNELGRSKRSSHKAGLVPSGMIGTLVGKDCKTGQEIRVGAGKMTADERRYWWEHRASIKGQIVKYKFFPSGGKEFPRHPTFLGFRDPRDMSKK